MGKHPHAPAGRRRSATPDPLRFRNGAALLDPDVIDSLLPDSVVFDVIRSDDLVCLTVEAHNFELLVGGKKPPALRAGQNSDAYLVVRWPFQHLAERAAYESPSTADTYDYDEKHPAKKPAKTKVATTNENPPYQGDEIRPAKTSRLVFDVPDSDEIEFSSEGILDAIARYPMRVPKLAAPPGQAMAEPGPSSTGFTLLLPGNLVALITAAGVTVSPSTKKAAKPKPAAGGQALLDANRRMTVVRAATEAHGRIIEVDSVLKKMPAFRRPTYSRPPRDDETAIEAPYRLIISPDAGAAWAHSNAPVPADTADDRVELWHTRLARRTASATDPVDEGSASQRIVRAVWTRDREKWATWRQLLVADHDDGKTVRWDPFRTSLDGADRHMLVRESAEAWLGETGKPIPPIPVGARGLWLSSLGAYLDLHGRWDTQPYSEAAMASILAWDHIAPLGRDQYVRVVYPGYLYPFGHKTALVKITERKMKTASNSVAGLYQRKFLVIGEPVKLFDQRDLPFTEVRVAPLVTPTLNPDPGNDQNRFFWPAVDGELFDFVLYCLDREHKPVKLVTPLLWVAEHFGSTKSERDEVDTAYVSHPDQPHRIPAAGQTVAFAPVLKGGDTAAQVKELRVKGKAGAAGHPSRPELNEADVVLPAIQHLSPVATPLTMKYAKTYLDHDFGAGAGTNKGDVWAEITNAANLSFGGSGTSTSEGAGGFLQPNIPLRGLSRTMGAVGDIAGAASQQFDPSAFLAGALPKLFGLVPLDELVKKLGPFPNVVSESLKRVEGLIADLERAKAAADEAVREAQKVGGAAGTEANNLKQKVTSAANGFITALQTVMNADETTIATKMKKPLDDIADAAKAMGTLAPKLTPFVRDELHKLERVLTDIAKAADRMTELYQFANGLAALQGQARFRFDWRPEVQSWKYMGGELLTIKDKKNGLVLSVDGRASGKGEMRVDVLAELREFTLNLFPKEPLVRAHFTRISFHSGSGGKTDVDVVFDKLEFVGILGFIETLKQLIPLDGFSDPPYLDVSPQGVKAGFTLALPSVAVGVFALSNISLGADVQVPFVGKVVTVGFDFCSRERPFTLQVTFIGGGGWFGLRLSPKGLDVLELGLEAGATLSVNLGVASGSISAMIGVYMRLEGDEGSLAGYFRLRGEVDVMGLVSASIELYLELKYQFKTGKMQGTATITVKVAVLVFSGTVSISCSRQFAGSNGDPTFRQLMVESNGSAPAWSAYCEAFA